VKLEGHTDWVRDVAFAPSPALGKTYLATCSQVLATNTGIHRFTQVHTTNYKDKTVLIWTQEPSGTWTKRLLKPDPFADVVWRVSWSVGGNILAVSCGDNKVSLWKENVDGVFTQVGDVNES
jgi:protein transport protein SEC13